MNAIVGSTTLVAVAVTSLSNAADSLPSWNDRPTKRAIVDFVANLTKKGLPEIVPSAQRVFAFK